MSPWSKYLPEHFVRGKGGSYAQKIEELVVVVVVIAEQLIQNPKVGV